MKKMRAVWMALAIAAAFANTACCAGKLVPPEPIFMPFDSRIVTELNFSKDDILGIIREILPAVSDLIAMGAAAELDLGKSAKTPLPPEALAKLDFKPLAEVMEGVTNLRYVAAKHRKSVPAADIAALFDSSAAKAGMVNRIAVDFTMMPGVFAAYAQPGGEAYLAYAYDSNKGMIYAGRLSGKIDVAKLVKWVGDTIKQVKSNAKPEEPVTIDEVTPKE